jgi:hypothetical protein
VRAAKKLLGAPTIGGGSARAGGGGGGVKVVMPPVMYENGKKTGGFAHFLAYKSTKTPFFAPKYLTKYTPETSFEEYINLKFFFGT